MTLLGTAPALPQDGDLEREVLARAKLALEVAGNDFEAARKQLAWECLTDNRLHLMYAAFGREIAIVLQLVELGTGQSGLHRIYDSGGAA